MIPCISQATTLSTPFDGDLPAFARAGWPGVELWLTKLEAYLEGHPVAAARSLLDDQGLKALAASGQGGLLLSSGPAREAAWDLFRRRLDLLNALGVPVLVVASDSVDEPCPDDYGRAAGSLAEAAELAGVAGVTLALEFVKSSRFCASLDTALALIAQGESPHLGVCLDLFHYYTGPSKFEDLAYLARGNLAWLQVCDLSGTPREVAADADRILPGEGDFQVAPILEHLARIGYDGGVSVEVLNPRLWRVPVDHLADAAFRSVVRTLTELPGGA
jgi:sugar phosphate isomerase/epimerase